MRSFVTAVVAAIEAVAIALAGFLVIVVPALLIWLVSFDMAAEPSAVGAISAAVWLLAHFVPLTFSVTQEAALGLGLAPESLSIVISLAPLGVTLVTVLLSGRVGWRLAERGGYGAAGLLGGSLGFGFAAFIATTFAGSIAARPSAGSIALCVLVYLVAAGTAFVVRAARDGHEWWATALRWVQHRSEWMGVRAAALPTRGAEVLRFAALAFAALFGLAGLAFALALVLGYADTAALTQQLQLGVFGSVMVFLLQLVLLPVAIIWAASWLTGAGFSVGTATSVTPFDTLLGPLPALPVFGAIPEGWGAFGALPPALLVLAGVGTALLLGRRRELRRASWPTALAIPLCAAALVGLTFALLGWAASGSIGPDRLTDVGVHPWVAGGLAAAELGAGMILGVTAVRIDYARLRESIPDGASVNAAAAQSLQRLRSKTLQRVGKHDAQDARPSLDEQQAGLPHDSDLQPTLPIVGAVRGTDEVDEQTDDAGSDPGGSRLARVGAADSAPDLSYLDEFERSETETGVAQREAVQAREQDRDQDRDRDQGRDSQGGIDPMGEDDRVRADGENGPSAGEPTAPIMSQETAEIDQDELLRAFSWDRMDAAPDTDSWADTGPVTGGRDDGARD